MNNMNDVMMNVMMNKMNFLTDLCQFCTDKAKEYQNKGKEYQAMAANGLRFASETAASGDRQGALAILDDVDKYLELSDKFIEMSNELVRLVNCALEEDADTTDTIGMTDNKPAYKIGDKVSVNLRALYEAAGTKIDGCAKLTYGWISDYSYKPVHIEEDSPWNGARDVRCVDEQVCEVSDIMEDDNGASVYELCNGSYLLLSEDEMQIGCKVVA